MRFIAMELNLAAHADNLHPSAPVLPMLDDFVFIFKIFTSTQIAIWSKPRQLTFFTHMIIKSFVCKSTFTKRAFELLRIKPSHHNTVDFGIEAFRFGTQRAFVAHAHDRALPPLSKAFTTLQAVAFFALTWLFNHIIADRTCKLSF